MIFPKFIVIFFSSMKLQHVVLYSFFIEIHDIFINLYNIVYFELMCTFNNISCNSSYRSDYALYFSSS